MSPKDKYTDPELRDQVKEEIHNSNKGGAPGQWSARKAQMMASEYKKRGGGYTTDKKDKDESQKHLDNWDKGRKAWEQMSEKEKQETDEKKQEESRGEAVCCQHVQGQERPKNTSKDQDDFKKQDGEADAASHEEKSDHSGSARSGEQAEQKPKIRGRGANQKGSNKKLKQKNGSSDQPKGTPGDKTRVPKKGQKVQWHSLPGYVDGEVVEMV
ncbi:hypothetical protein BU26DRAFT_560175 [Trematosphaeria pertusa]|uniref:Hypervirulence associated protein TUDOR domain-containing protein n=1 Tax=Trematosphaeria pertusa TaxID=390896 RepID=A0A6A6IR24_9PLEO|nr:uncharacterized protein BU26DRAFT_560175 [Trematosphaeria pertusa]KAF2252826.1 hypothetical protein BU26DRAFT_560175 [Trematosphaeria pertusa]